MGCDIHGFLEIRKNNKWEKFESEIFPEYDDYKTSAPFQWRNYGLFGFLADVRNYSCVPPIQERIGLPKDSDFLDSEFEKDWYTGDIITQRDYILDYDGHSHSHIYLKTLLEFDYSQSFWDRRVTKGNNGASLAEEGEGRVISFKDFLGEGFFEHIELMKSLGSPEDVRFIFWFDS